MGNNSFTKSNETQDVKRYASMKEKIETTRDIPIKQRMVEMLKKDCKTLMEYKIPDALRSISDDKGVNTYRNLTRALADNIKLIEEYDYQLMWSKYTTTDVGGREVRQVAIWEQNGDGDIKNHKYWNVEEQIWTVTNSPASSNTYIYETESGDTVKSNRPLKEGEIFFASKDGEITKYVES